MPDLYYTPNFGWQNPVNGAFERFALEPYDMPEFDIWGKEISAPDGSLITYGAGNIKIKFKAIPVFGAGSLATWSLSWAYAQVTDNGEMTIVMWWPSSNAWEPIRCKPRFFDPSGKFKGRYVYEMELELTGINLPFGSGYTGGNPFPPTGPGNVYDPKEEPDAFGYGGFGEGPFGGIDL